MTNPSEEDIQARIVEELGPEPNWASMTPDQVELRKKSRQFDEVHIRLSYNKEAAQVFKDIMGEFSAERVPIEVTQADIKKVVKGQEHLEQIFSQFLEVDLDAGDDQNRVRARKALCDCSGGGGTRKWTGEANRPNLVELLFFLRVQQEVPQLLEKVYSLYDRRTGVWNMRRDEAYEILQEITADQPELLMRARKLRRRWNPDYLYAEGSTYDSE